MAANGIGVQSYTFRKFDAQGAIDKAAALGMTSIEFFPGHFPTNADRDARDAMAKATKAAGLAMFAFGVVRLQADEAASRPFFEFAKSMGIKVLTAAPDRDAFDTVEKLVKEYNIPMAIHNHGPGAPYATPEEIMEAVDGRDVRLGACVDTGHFLRAKADPVEAVRILGKRVHAVHLKDIRSYEDHTDTVLGEGLLDIAGTLAALKQVKYTAPLTIEYEADPEDPSVAVGKSVKVIRSILGA